MTKWTDDQQKAIECNDKDILVAAAAGSGKTAVLVERVVSHLLLPKNDKNRWEVDKLMIVTFTNAAAEEMRQRIEQSLEEKITLERAKENIDEKLVASLERQIILLSNAAISTMHSFCQNLIRQNFTVLDLDPAFRAGNNQEINILKQEVLEQVFEKYYEDENSYIYDFSEKYGSNKNGDEVLYPLVLKIYNMAYNQPFPQKWLDGIKELFIVEDGARLFDTFWGKMLKQHVMDKLSAVEKVLPEYKALLDQVTGTKKNVDKAQEFYSRDENVVNTIKSNLENGSFDNIAPVFYDKFQFRTASLGKESADIGNQAKYIRDNKIKPVFDDLKKNIFYVNNEKGFLQDISRTAEDVNILCDLVSSFADAYAAKKREKNIIDFTDMEHLALKILLDADAEACELKPSNVAIELRKRFQEIMVDEYQDTNEVQDAIVRLIAGENSGKVFNVGDVKQSIYRFRSADPALFQRKYELFDSEEKPKQQLICLSNNFRSRKSVLEAINFIFAQCMTKKYTEIDYDSRAALYAGLDYGMPVVGDSLDNKVEIHIVDKGVKNKKGSENEAEEEGEEQDSEADLSGLELEFNMIAARLREIYDSGIMVYDKNYPENNHYRRVSWRDMVILMRSLSQDTPTIALEALQAYNIPAYSSKGGSYFYTTEIQIITALLTIIDNARQDIPLATILYSPIVNLTAKEIAELRLSADGELFNVLLSTQQPECTLPDSIKQKIGSFLENLARWRKLSRYVGVPELIWQLYRDTGYYDFVGGLPGGLIRQANLRAFITRAENYEKTDFRGLFRFLRFIKRLRDMDNDLEVARTLGENEDVVRIMTIHKSKGLEFPIVVVANTNRKFNNSDVKGDIIINKELGIGIKYIDLPNFVRYDTISHMIVANKIMQENNAEELRVLYVALTRAREKLIITGSVDDYKNSCDKWCSKASTAEVQLPQDTILKSNNYLSWIMPAVIRHSDIRKMINYDGELAEFEMGLSSSWDLKIHSASSIKAKQTQLEELNEQLELVRESKPLPLLEEEMETPIDIEKRLSWQYDYAGTENIPAKLSVSEIKTRFAVYTQDDGSLQFTEWDKAEVEKQELIFSQPEFIKEKRLFSGAEYGTLMHSVMQHIDISGGVRSITIRNIAQQLDRMVEEGVILPEHKQAIYIKNIVNFFNTDIGKEFFTAKHIWRELPFSRMLRAKAFYPEVSDASTMIFSQGVIDVLLQTADGRYIIVDYKTDRETNSTTVKNRYRVQLAMYAKAIEEIMRVKVDQCYLYMLHDGTLINI